MARGVATPGPVRAQAQAITAGAWIVSRVMAAPARERP